MNVKIIALISVVLVSPFLISEAFAEMNVTERMEDYEMTQINDNKWLAKLGLPTHIQNATGDWIANIFTEDANGLQLESGSLSYYFDKNSCAMSLFNSGMITNQSNSIISGDMWKVKQALNGTENWTDVSQNNLACTVSNTIEGDMIEINSTKSDINGTISEIYHYDMYQGLKHTIYFTNNDPSLTNHKFSFSNILEDIPKSFTTIVVTDQSNGTSSFDYYSLLDSVSQPFQFGGNGTVMDFSASEIVQYNGTQYSFNGTEFYHGFNMIEDLGSNDSRTIVYDFGDGLAQLSEVNFQSLPDQTLDVYIHYQNGTAILPVGGTISLDPQINFDGASGFSMRRAISIGTSITSCTGAVFRGADTIFEIEQRRFGGGTVCRYPMMFFDISAIPDTATPIRVTFSVNLTGSQTQGFTENFKDEGRVFDYLTEDLLNVDDVTLSKTLIQGFKIFAPDGALWHFLDGNIFRFCAVNTCPFTLVSNVTTSQFPPPAITQLELQLESGRDYLQLWFCTNFPSSGLHAPPRDPATGCSFGTNQAIQLLAFFDQPTTSLEIEFEFFPTPDAPSSQTATYSPSPDKCLVDWEPEFDGGHPLGLLGWNIQRSINGGAFTTIVASAPNIPTDHTDTTIVSDESYVYRIAGINAEGVGAFAVTNSCGIPSISDPPVGLIAFEQPDRDITLDWESAPFDGGLPVLGYKIEKSTTGGTFQVLEANTNSQATTFIDIAVQANTVNTYRVSQINSLGTSSPSNESSFTVFIAGAGAGAGAGSPVAPPPEEVTEDLLTQEQFDLALAQAIAQIPLQEVTVFETIVQTFFEFAVVDTSLEDVTINSILENERLGIRWSSGQDIVIVSARPAESPFLISFEQLPAVKQGSGAVISTDFLLYNLQVPRNECSLMITMDCVEKLRYEVPVTVEAIINGTNVSDVGTITVDLVDELIDPILLILIATFSIPLIGVFVQRARGRRSTPPVSSLLKT